jgi:hypothetical protein
MSKGPALAARHGWFAWLEVVTAGLLLVVLAAVGWLVLAAYAPAWAAWPGQEVQVLVLAGLLLAALLLVSAVALCHTRSAPSSPLAPPGEKGRG